MSMCTSSVWPLPIYLDSWIQHSRFLCNIVLYSIRLYFHHQSHPQLGTVFALARSLHSFWSYFSTLLQYHIGHLPTWGVHLSVSCLFAFLYCSWGSQGKNTEVVCHSLMLLQISPNREKIYVINSTTLINRQTPTHSFFMYSFIQKYILSTYYVRHC